jgi:hypothetical protein
MAWRTQAGSGRCGDDSPRGYDRAALGVVVARWCCRSAGDAARREPGALPTYEAGPGA